MPDLYALCLDPRSFFSDQTEQSFVALMSSTNQLASSTSSASTSNIRLITDALVEYTATTGIDLSKNPFAVALNLANSPYAILQLLQEREKAFNEYRDGNRRLINCLSPAVKVIQAFSGIMGEAVNFVSHEYDRGHF